MFTPVSQASFRVKPVYVETGSTPLGRWTLRRVQEEVMDALASNKDALLVAPTGAGKTLSLLLGSQGAVGIYPNNRLLLDQQRSLDRILGKALNARLVYSSAGNGIDVLRIYEVSPDGRDGPPIASRKRVAVVLLSGRYIGYEQDEDGGLIPKRQVVLRNIVDRICYTRPGEEPYTITLATPDTALLVMAGMYRDFEKVGYTVHDAILAALEGSPIEYVLSKTQVAAARGSLAQIGQIRQCLLKYPWFIDEFHLYGSYEASALAAILRVYRDYVGWNEPIIMSSATPRGTLYERLREMLKPTTIHARVSERGDPEAMVRGETEVIVYNLEVGGRGVGKWFRVGDLLPSVVDAKLDEITTALEGGGNVFIVVDRINQVPPIVSLLAGKRLPVECGVTMPPPGCNSREERLLVGSESVSQGIDRENVVYGIITGFNWATLIQRFGRIGRKTDSKIVIVTPYVGGGGPLSSLDGSSPSYDSFVDTVRRDFPSVELELPSTRSIKEVLDTRETLLEYSTTVAFAQVSKPKGTFDALARRISMGENPLDKLFGPPETIASLMMFRSTGFEVLVECTTCPHGQGYLHTSDIASVLRNYIVHGVKPVLYKTQDTAKRIVKLTIDYTPGRQILVLKPPINVREDLADYLNGSITTLHELSELGFRLYISSPDGNGEQDILVPIVGSTGSQVVAFVEASEEVAMYLAYTLNAILVHRGQRKELVALFM